MEGRWESVNATSLAFSALRMGWDWTYPDAFPSESLIAVLSNSSDRAKYVYQEGKIASREIGEPLRQIEGSEVILIKPTLDP